MSGGCELAGDESAYRPPIRSRDGFYSITIEWDTDYLHIQRGGGGGGGCKLRPTDIVFRSVE